MDRSINNGSGDGGLQPSRGNLGFETRIVIGAAGAMWIGGSLCSGAYRAMQQDLHAQVLVLR